MNFINTFGFVSLVALPLLAASTCSAQAPDFVPANNRLAEKPAWETDVTERLALENGDSYARVMSRAARVSRVRGGQLKWSLPLRISAAQAAWPVALEADEARVFSSASLDGEPLRFDRRDTGDLWFSGEGAAILPLTAQKLAGRVALASADIPQAYENGFGRLRLRPATLNELLRFSRDDSSGAVRAINRSPLPLTFVVRVLLEDYFGVPLGSSRQSMTLAPNGEATVAMPEIGGAGELYKTRVWGEIGARKTFEYHANSDGQRITRQRPNVLRLDNNWERAFVNGPPAQTPLPAEGAPGWIAPNVRLTPEMMTSHYLWARQSFIIPASWPANQRIQMLLPNSVSLHAIVRIDGQAIGEVAGWEMPKRFMLPAGLRPGTRHTIELGVTDYIVGLAPGVKIPPPGPFNAGSRTFAATTGATGAMQIGLNVSPELVPVPATRTIRVAVIPRVAGGKSLEARAEIESDVADPSLSIRMRVFERGQEVFDLGRQALSVSGARTTSVSLRKAWLGARLWNLERPHLYEMRTEILDGAGQVLDTRRDRFGFREFGVAGGYFTLNGEIVKAHGGSHNFSTALLWPARPSPYRILRHQAFSTGVTGGGQTQGIISLNAADELGYLIKGDVGNVNSHGADNYAWQLPVMWERLYSGSTSVIAAYLNHPSAMMWDVGNEISFRGPGESEKMGELFARVRAFDPTRLVTVGGSSPLVAGGEVVNYHGWGAWKNRTDYFFWRPEERPKYLRDAGYFQHRPANEPASKWTVDLLNSSNWLQLYPGYARELRHIDNRPAMFAEGVYMENIDTFPMHGNDTFLNLPPSPSGETNENSWRDLNVLVNRRLAIQNVRQAGFSSSMIHVSGGTGRYLLPVMSASWDRKFRFLSGTQMQTRFGVHYDLSTGAPVNARYRLFDGEKLIAAKSAALEMKPGQIAFVALDFSLPTATADRTLRLEVRVWPQSGSGAFFDDVPITLYAPKYLALPTGQNLAVFDPQNAVIPTLRTARVPFVTLARLSDWNAQGTSLLIGSEGLRGAPEADIAGLAPKVEAGGRLVVLDHFSLPQFLPRSLVQSREMLSYVARMDGPSPMLEGIANEDLRAWTTRARDQITSWNPLETPSTGHFRVHVTTIGSAPILEVGQGRGRVLFVHLNLKDALGVEPAATQVLANALKWTASPSPFASASPSTSTVIVAGDDKLAASLQNRVGLEAKTSPAPDAKLVVASGTSPETLRNLESNRAKLKSNLQGGGTLFFYGLDEDGARWLSEFTGSPVKIEPFAHRYAFLTRADAPLLAGLGHGDFWINGLGKGLNLSAPTDARSATTGSFVLSGPQVLARTRPAYISEIAVGQGRIVVDLVRSLENPVPSQMRVLSMLLSNAGARLDPDGGAKDSTRWSFQTLDLTPFVNRSLRDTDDPTQPRGYNGSGVDDDLRDFPTGKQTLRGVDYDITPGEKAKGNSLILLAGKNAQLGGLTEVKGIKVGRKAERLYFLHNAAWGIPGFIYRVYYTADRKVWIPGKPDPFVDVVVKPNENITEWVLGHQVERGTKFLPGASVAWLGGNVRTRAAYQGGDKYLGVYQMTWDNPFPDKEIESIDILSPQTVGSGNAFVFAITAANRDESSQSGASNKPPLTQVLAGTNAEDVLEQVQFPNYGFVLAKDGTLASIYDAQGQPFARSTPWVANASGGAPGAPRQSEKIAAQTDAPPQIAPAGKGGRRVWEFAGKGALDWKATVIATPGRLRYELRYTPTQPLKPFFNGGLSTGLAFINGAQASVSVNENPFPVRTKSGEAIVAFDRRHTRWVFSYQVSKGGFNFNSPPRDGAPWTTGREESLWWEITPP